MYEPCNFAEVASFFSHPTRLRVRLPAMQRFAAFIFLGLTCLNAIGQDPGNPGDSQTKKTQGNGRPDQIRPALAVIRQLGRDGSVRGQGTGFVVSKDGLVATNLHVVGEARPVSVELSNGTKHDVAGVHAWDRKADLAILKIDAADLAVLPLGDSDIVKQGDPIVAMGNPEGLDFSFVNGVISAVREMDSGPMFQLAMPIEQGNSGSPVVDSEGKAVGVITMKSLRTENLGFAVPVNKLRALLDQPNPVAMKAWVTLGSLPKSRWKPLGEEVRWSRQLGMIAARGQGTGYGGRALCLSKREVPELPYDVEVEVRLNGETGAAGLLFASDGGDVHYGFYPTSGKLRLTRFDGPTVFSWQILDDTTTDAYRPGEWNRIRVRVEADSLTCYVNGVEVIASDDVTMRAGKAGLCKFRHTQPDFRRFRLGRDLAESAEPDTAVSSELERLISGLDDKAAELPPLLLDHPETARALLEKEELRLGNRARRLGEIRSQIHENRVKDFFAKLLAEAETEEQIGLFDAGMLIAQLAQPDLDPEAYRDSIEQLAEEVSPTVEAEDNDLDRLRALNRFLFEENGFHGSRFDYYNEANSYLNAVIDDREGIPITLSVLYMELAERLGIKTVRGIGMPGHFVVEYRSPDAEDDVPGQLIDVFERGRFLSREEAASLVEQYMGRPVGPGDFAVSTKRQILVRMLRNLIGIRMNSEDVTTALPFLNLLLVIDENDSTARFQRALMNYQKGRLAAARVDVVWLMDNPPPGLRLDRLEELLRAIDAN